MIQMEAEMAKPKPGHNGRDSNNQQEASAVDLLRQGTEALHQGQLDEAVRLLEHSYNLDNTNHDTALNLGGAYILAKNYAKAITILEALSKSESENPMVWTNLGAAYLGDPDEAEDKDQQRAIAAFEQAIELDPLAPNVAYNLGLIYRDRQDNGNALHWFKRALEADPNDKDAKHYIEQLTKTDSTED